VPETHTVQVAEVAAPVAVETEPPAQAVHVVELAAAAAVE
jgi:hypothetical protein